MYDNVVLLIVAVICLYILVAVCGIIIAVFCYMSGFATMKA